MNKIRTYVNDDSDIGYYIPYPMRKENIFNYIRTLYANNGIDVFSWDVCKNGSLIYDTKAGSPIFADRTDFPALDSKIFMSNYRRMSSQNDDVMKCTAEACHKYGMRIFTAFRMGFYVTPYNVRSALHYNDFVKDRGHLTIGNTEGAGGYGVEPGRYISFEHEEARDYFHDIICEAVDKYAIDGIELNFIRGHFNFDADRAGSLAYLMTDLIRKIREHMRMKDKKLLLAVRVPFDYKWSASLGLDVREWVNEGIVDIVMPSQIHGTEFFLTVDEYVRMCSGTGCIVLPTIQNGYPIEHLCAVCDNWYKQGADGISSFNFHHQPQLRQGINVFKWFRIFGNRKKLDRIRKVYPFLKDTYYSTAARSLATWSEPELNDIIFPAGTACERKEITFPVIEVSADRQCYLEFKAKQLDETDELKVDADGTDLEIVSKEYFVAEHMYYHIYGKKGGHKSYSDSMKAGEGIWPAYQVRSVLPPGRQYKKLGITIKRNSGFVEDIRICEIEAVYEQT